MIKKFFILAGLTAIIGISAQKTHTVVKGDTSYNIAKRYGMSVDDLVKLNPNSKDGKIAIGDVLMIAKSANNTSPSPVKTTSSSAKLGKIILKPKQTIYGITKQYQISETDLRMLNPSLDSHMKIGDEVEAVVLTLDREERKMSLGIKQMTQDPWTDITSKYPVGSKHTGIVRNFTNFGIFVELEEGIDGLVYISDLSWTKKIKHPSEFVNVGENLDVVVLELDVDGRKLSLGHKQTTANPWDKYEEGFAVGTIHNGTISEIVDKGATVEFGDDIVAFIPTRHLEKEDGKKLKKGDAADFKVIEFNKEFKRVVASHTAIFREEEEKNVKTAVDTSSASTAAQTSTLGDNNDILAELKAKMEKGGN